jgi:DnaJ-class molecular chaperone|tara:strand:+ start:483 stop:587 length:105 start_codon:yes stop_codon:yes gene_type:complete
MNNQKCIQCDGSGNCIDMPCPACNGLGFLKSNEE